MLVASNKHEPYQEVHKVFDALICAQKMGSWPRELDRIAFDF